MNHPSSSADSEKDERLNSVLAEYLKRKDAGKPVNKKTLLAAYPDLADALQSYFEGEALIGDAALKHPNICSVFDAGEHEGTAYITMDFIDGVPLSRFIGSSKLQSLESVLRMLKTIAQAVEHAHSKGVIHRDLKPGNILVDGDFNPVVTDFGLARRVESADESRITQEGLLIGTPAYMAPEQVKGEQAKVGTASDIYSLGVIFFEMLTCRLPFDGKMPELLAKVLRDAPPIPSKIRTDLPEDVDDLCLKMLQKLPEHRYGSIASVIKAITLVENKIKQAPVTPGPNAQQQSPFEIQKAHIELMLKKGQYTAAIQDLEKLAAEKSPGARVVGEWARKTLTTARAESKALSPAGLAALLQTAEQMFQKSDYLGCIQLLEDVPTLRRTDAMEDLLRKACKREADSEELLADIKDLEHRQQIDGLEPLVKRFLKLKPGSSYGKRLLEALQSYGKTPASRRTYHYDKGRLQAMPEPSFVKQWAVLGSLVFVLAFLSVYSYVIFYLKSGNQTLAVHVDDDWLRGQGGEITLLVDGNKHTISMTSKSGEDLSIVVTLGEHVFSVQHGDTVVHDPKTFDIQKDGRRIVCISPTDIRLEGHIPTQPPATLEEPPKKQIASDHSLDQPRDHQGGSQQNEETWISLFEGSDVSRWSSLGGFSVQEGLLTASGKRENAVSRDQYGDFELEATWRIRPESNSGIYYREIPTGQVMEGNEYSIVDSSLVKDSITDELARRQYTGSLWGLMAVPVGIQPSIDDWNTTKIVCRGPKVEHWLNEQRVVTYDTSSSDWQQILGASTLRSTSKEQIGTRKRGHILLQYNGGEIAFRSIRIRELTPRIQEKPQAPSNDSLKHFSQINSGTRAELISWSKNLPEGYRPTWISVRPTEKQSLFNAVAIESRDHGEWILDITDPNDRGLWESFKQKMASKRMEFWIEYKIGEATESMIVWSDGEPVRRYFGNIDNVRVKIESSLKVQRAAVAGPESLIPKGLSARDGFYRAFSTYEPTVQCQTELSLTYVDLVTRVEEYRKKGWRPRIVDSILYTSPPRYLAVFVENPRAEKWEFTPRLTENEYHEQLSVVDSKGGHPRCVFSREDSGEIVYSALWDYPANPKAISTPISDDDFQAVAPFNSDRAKKYQEACAKHLKLPVEFTNSIGMKFRLIPPGTFTIGSPPDQIARAKPYLHTSYEADRPARADSEGPQQVITISKPFYLGVTEVTQNQFGTVVGVNPSSYSKTGDGKDKVGGQDRSNAPAENMSWLATGEFCNRLSTHEKLDWAYRITPELISQMGTGGYRLPSEAEWEYACRAGTITQFHCGHSGAALKDAAWFNFNNPSGFPSDVAKLAPNPFGLYDMHGNVWEWVHDCWRPDTYKSWTGSAAVDPRNDTATEDRRVIRGGDFFLSAEEARSACRDAYPHDAAFHDVGFRVAISVEAVRQILTAK